MHRRPLAQWIAAAFAMSAMHAHAGGPPLSQAWLASQRQAATGSNPQATPGSAGVPGLSPLTAAQAQQQQSVQQALQNLNRAAQAVAAQISAQQAAQQAAAAQAGSPVPDGIAAGGLQVAAGIASNPALWQNANAPTQSVSNGQTNVEVKQTAQKAILTWDSFNVGRHTTLHFDQTGGTQTDGSNNWIALNRINDTTGPSKIFGQIKAEGSVYLINRNGILFGAGSQVNTHSLLATSMNLFSSDVNASNAFFLQSGIAQTNDPNHVISNNDQLAAFLVDGGQVDSASGKVVTSGAITVEKGASIQSQAQGYILLAAPTIQQSGSLVADDGTAILASADRLKYVAPGSGSSGSFTVARGDSPALLPNWTGTVENDGVIQTRRGDVQWLGTSLQQNGVVVASTSLTSPGKITFNGIQIGATTSNVELGQNAVITVLPEKDGETTSSSSAADQAFQTSSITLASTGSIVLDQGALIEAPSGNVSLLAIPTGGSPTPTRVYIDHGAIIDVSGLTDVELPMSALLVSIPRIGQNELADSPLLRNSFLFAQKNVVIDSSQSGTRADGLDWVGSPVLNAAGYVENVPRSIDQLMLKGGTITLTADEVITRSGSQLNLNGGYLNYLAGWIQTPNLLGADGRIYNIASADPDMDYVGFAGQFNADHARWGVTETYSNPLLAGMVRYDTGFIQGVDAGSLIIGGNGVTGVAQLDGSYSAQAYRGRNQVSQGNAPSNGSFEINTGEAGVSAAGVNFKFVDSAAPIESINPLFDADTALGGEPDEPGSPQTRWYLLPADLIERGGFARVKVSTGGAIEDDAHTFSVQPGGEIDLTGASVKISGTLQAASGIINVTGIGFASAGGGIFVDANGKLDARGLWVNDSGLSTDTMAGSQYINGGQVSLSTWQQSNTSGADQTGGITLAAGSVIDVSSGGYVQQNGIVATSGDMPIGTGGDISIATHVASKLPSDFTSLGGPTSLNAGALALDGTLLGYGFSGGGSLTLEAPLIQIGGTPSVDSPIPLLYLPASFFSGQGFASYKLISETDASIATGTSVQVRAANLLPNYNALAAATTGTDIYTGGLTQIGYLDDYHRWLGTAGAGNAGGISIQAGLYSGWVSQGNKTTPSYSGVTGSLVVGEGASLTADAGDSVLLQAADHLDVFGSVTAHGGSITLNNIGYGARVFAAPDRALWIGASSVIDTSGVSLINPIASVSGTLQGGFIPRTGTVLDGGAIDLNAEANLVAESGSRLDVSGASDVYDLPSAQSVLGSPVPATTPTAVWSDAGSINLAAANGMFVDATLDAHAGAPQGLGGSLSILPLKAANTSQPSPKAVVLQQSGDLVPTGAQPGDVIGSGSSAGVLYFAADRLDGSGMADFSIGPVVGDSNSQSAYAEVPVVFAGNVTLNLGRSVSINAPALIAAPAETTALPGNGTVSGAGLVSINAPYVYLASGNSGAKPVAVGGDGKLAVHADFIDLGGQMSLEGFADASFQSEGDLRFYLPPLNAYENGQPQTGWLYTTGNLDFAATRIYPDSDYSFLIDAAPLDGTQTTTVTFSSNGHSDSSTPLSAGGTLAVAANEIVQGGTLWVPSGDITLGVSDPVAERTALGLSSTFALPTTDSVQLTVGSVTSVSLGGATLPFGSTLDGKEWRYDADPAVTGSDIIAPPAKQIEINGQQVALQQGATVDLSGGGQLQAFEWVPGTGGSRDVLAQSQPNYTNSSTGTAQSQYPDGRAIYAIVPGYTAPVSAHDAALEKGAGAGPSLGQAVYLSGVPGLAPGVYTLLPARYATLPGAFRVVQDTSSQDAVLGRNTTTPDGTNVVAGYFVDALTGARSARTTTFDVQSSATWQQYSQYTLTDADTFFSAQAQHNGNVAPPLARDAGNLLLQAGQQLELGATLTAGMGTGGRGAEVDIAGQAIEIVASGQPALDGYLAINAADLSTLGASSLLIGGSRTASSDGDVIDVKAQSIVVANDAAQSLVAPEIILVTNGQGNGIELNAGSVLRGEGDSTGLIGTPLLIGQLGDSTHAAVSGDGALLRVSSGAPSPIVRQNVTGVDGAAGTATGDISIADGATVTAANALSIDATGNTHVGANALLAADNVDVTANRIAFVGDGVVTDTSGMLIGGATLAQLAGAQSIVLRSRGDLDFIGNVDVDVANGLELDAQALEGDGGIVNIAAGKLGLTNTSGRTSAFASGSGALNLQANELDLGEGAFTLHGFDAFSAKVAQGIAAQGNGDFDFGNLDVTLNTPVVLADSGAALKLHTTGALDIEGNAGTALSRTAFGGGLTLSGGTVKVATQLVAQAGSITLDATTGDLTLDDGASLNAAGAAKTFNDVQSFASGGTVTLDAANGDIQASAQSLIDIAGASQGGNGGKLVVQSGGNAQLLGTLEGGAASNYLGGVLQMDVNGTVDLNSLADVLAPSGINGAISIHTHTGNLDLDAGRSLVAHQVVLTADGDPAQGGGWVHVDGTIDASGTFGGPIQLYGQAGVDVEGTLSSFATAPGREGGDITLGTGGKSDGSLNANYGYENITAVGSGQIILGEHAVLNMGGDGGDGGLLLRAPVLSDGDVLVNIASGAKINNARGVTLEADATWSSGDAVGDPAKHFDGLIDPAGWYVPDPTTGAPVLVAGQFVDAKGNPVAAPDPNNAEQMADYLAKYYFVPDANAVNAAHQSFYGYLNGDASQGPGALMGFVENPGFAFGSRFASVANFNVRPGINLVNPDTSVNSGNISVLTTWNLGAGVRNADGTLSLAYRYGNQAPILNFRAVNNLDIRASITDGFFQSANVEKGAAPDDTGTYDEALAEWNMIDALVTNDIGGGTAQWFPMPDEDVMGQSNAGQYYSQYILYAKYLLNVSDTVGGGGTGLTPADVIAFGEGLGGPVSAPGTIAAPTLPTTLADYPGYLTAYDPYLVSAVDNAQFLVNLTLPDDFQVLAAPPTVGTIPSAPPTLDNSPSPLRTPQNPLPLLSATLSGGNSSSYRLVAGADVGSANPLAVLPVSSAGSGQLMLGGHTEFDDAATSSTVYAPTLVRTGTGNIDLAASGDIVWLDNLAPAAVYAAGVPLTSGGASTAALVQPSGSPEMVVSNPVNPVDGGDISITAGGNIVGIQQVFDTDGSVTGTKGLSTAQYWWQWMQMGNPVDGSRSSINFSSFDQGVMSVGGNVDVEAGGDIRQLSVSLPTTWYLTTDASGSKTVNTVGGGNLNVNAGGDILSGSYFVAKGAGNITAQGRIGADFNYNQRAVDNNGQFITISTPVDTLLAVQDAQLTVQAGSGADIGGVYNPSWLDATTPLLLDKSLPARHFDGQSYSAASSVSVLSASGDVNFGTLDNSLELFVPSSGLDLPPGSAGFVLPASVSLTSLNGNLNLLTSGELYPSSNGNLSLLAGDSIHFDNAREAANNNVHIAWGLIDAPASLLPSPLNIDALTGGVGSSFNQVLRAGGYLFSNLPGWSDQASLLHQAQPLHGADEQPVRVYALTGDIVNGDGGGLDGVYLVPNKPARIIAGEDIVDLAFIGQQTHDSDVTLISAGRDIYDTSLLMNSGLFNAGEIPNLVSPVILQSGPGNLQILAGRDIGPLTSQVDLAPVPSTGILKDVLINGDSQTGIETIGNALNPWLPDNGASLQIFYGVGPGIDQSAFIAKYIDPNSSVAGIASLTPALVTFMNNYTSGLVVDTGLVKDQVSSNLTVDQAWAQFQALPVEVQRIFVQQALFKILATVGQDYNDSTSPYHGQYARGYEALSSLFPASLGYTDNGSGAGGINGAQKTVDTGDLDIRNSTIQTQQGGNIAMLAPGGEALLGSSSAPPVITDSRGNVIAGPNSMGVLTLRQGDIDIFTDRSVLLAQSRIFTEQGGDIVAWSSNGDINAGKGAKTTTEIPPLTYICDLDAYCLINPAGQVSGAGIATLQTVAGAAVGNAFLMAPRGTVDAGDAGIRVSGNLVVAAAQVANADNIQVQGEKIGVPVASSVNIGALSAASAAASAVSHVAEEMADKQRNDARNQQPSVISVHVLGSGENSSSVQGIPGDGAYDPASPVQVLGAGRLSSAKRKVLTTAEQQALSE
ncbi:hypothetical protein DYGSA30_24850 [Dyella sp. GSA-30]|nr:hypothetical protein DYGSA30_24850 [Dyella sp. GSA-30]